MTNSDESQTLTNNLIRYIPVLTGFVGIFVALLWYFGREFAAGYFRSLGIPEYLVSFSVWEYAGTAWYFPLVLALFMALLIEGGLKLTTLIFYILRFLVTILGNALAFIRVKLFPRIPISKTQKPHKKKQAESFFHDRSWYFAMGIWLIVAIILLGRYVNYWGEFNGQYYLQKGLRQIGLVSMQPLDLPYGGQHVLINEESGFVYDGYFLLTYNQDRYFVFNELDLIACAPKEVFIVSSNRLSEVKISGIKSFKATCFENDILKFLNTQ